MKKSFGNLVLTFIISYNIYLCFVVVDQPCVVSEWSYWSAPDSNGVSRRTREVLRATVGEGQDCPDLQETKQGKLNF